MTIANRNIYIAICNIRQEGIFELLFGLKKKNPGLWPGLLLVQRIGGWLALG
jgi:hypothetical protein